MKWGSDGELSDLDRDLILRRLLAAEGRPQTGADGDGLEAGPAQAEGGR